MLKQLVPAAISGGLVATMLLSGCGTTGDATKGAAVLPEPAAFLHVAPNGNDAWSGRLAKPNADKTDGPLATLGHARDEIRKLKKVAGLPAGPIAIELRGGVYELNAPFDLTAEDSGTEPAPIVYRAKKGEAVRLVGGKILTGWQPVTDSATLDRLDPTARGKVFQTDLRAQGVTDFGQLQPTAAGWARAPVVELFFGDQPMVLARWPNEGFVRIASVVGGDSIRDKFDRNGTTSVQFSFEGDRWRRWLGEKELWLHGYWFWDWADQRQKVASIAADTGVISLAKPFHYYGYRKGQRFCAFNALSEIDTPGEWYLDRGTGVLYFWPPAPIETGNPTLSILPGLVKMKDVSFTTLRRMTLEATRGTAVEISGGAHCRVEGCVIRNAGNWAVWITGGTDHGVAGCDVSQTGDGGIMLVGGDRKTLTPAGHFAENNHIHHYSRINRICNPAVSLNGVGNRATHNLIDHAPHCAIMFGGNDHLMEFNEMHNVCYESSDAGAIYAGRSWTMRGNVIRYNYLHHIQGLAPSAASPGTRGIYLDDLFAGAMVFGNVFYRVPQAVIFSGRDNTIENNVFVECEPAVWGYFSHCFPPLDNDEGMVKGLSEMPYKDALWSARYPLLPNILEDSPFQPKRSAIVRNICTGGSLLRITEEKGRACLRVADNLVGEDPRFVDAKHGKFQLRDNSPAFKLGFQRIPVEKIGLCRDGLRASWPVKHEVQDIAPPSPETSKPAPPRFTRTGPAPVFAVRRATAVIQVDGTPKPEEWAGADPAQAMPIEQGLEGEKVKPASVAWFAYDDQCLYVAVDNAVNPAPPLKPGDQWGRDDAVELAFRNTAAGKDAPVLVLRGYPSGHFESSPEAGAPETAVKKAAEGVVYGARIVDPGRWTAEWKIPLASLGIDPAKQPKFAFNLSVHKTAGPEWVLWQGTRAATWEVGNAGVLELVQP